nr:unnamed protein product [Haemonchus contortus]
MTVPRSLNGVYATLAHLLKSGTGLTYGVSHKFSWSRCLSEVTRESRR